MECKLTRVLDNSNSDISRSVVSHAVLFCGGDAPVLASKTSTVHVGTDRLTPANGSGVFCNVGGCVFANSTTPGRMPCTTLLGTFFYNAHNAYVEALQEGGRKIFKIPIVNYPLVQDLRMQQSGGNINDNMRASTQGTAYLQCAIVDRNHSDRLSTHSIADRQEQYSTFIFKNYIRPFYARTNGSQLRPSAPKLTSYHVPGFTLFDGTYLPASAYMKWRCRQSVKYTVDNVRYSLKAALDGYPEIGSVSEFKRLLGQLTRSDGGYLKRLSFEHTSAIRVAIEILTQYSTSSPYVEDSSLAHFGSGLREMETDSYCPASMTSGTDCEDGAKMVTEIKRIVEENPRAMGDLHALSTLYSYFAHFVAITYCGDSNPEQMQYDNGLCHVVAVLMPKTAASEMVAADGGIDYARETPSVMRAGDHWTRDVSLIVPETTALADPLVYPPTRDVQRIRSDCEAARLQFVNAMGDDANFTCMTRDTFVKRKLHSGGGGGAGAGYCASTFYQWCITLWDRDGNDMLAVYVNRSTNAESSWGVRFSDISAQALMSMKSRSRNTMIQVYGSDVVSRLSKYKVAFNRRLVPNAACVALIDDILARHMPEYTVVPAQDSYNVTQAHAKHEYARRMINRAIAEATALTAISGTPKDASRYVRVDIYANSALLPDSHPHSAYSTIMAIDKIVDRKRSSMPLFSKCSLSFRRIYENAHPFKLTILLFFDSESIDRSVIDRDRSSSASRGNFATA